MVNIMHLSMVQDHLAGIGSFRRLSCASEQAAGSFLAAQQDVEDAIPPRLAQIQPDMQSSLAPAA